MHKHHLAKVSSNRNLCVAIHLPSLSWPCLQPSIWGFLWWDSDIMTWRGNGSRCGHSRSRQCIFTTAPALIYWAWSPYEKDAGVDLCWARGKCLLTPMQGQQGDAHPQLQTAVETDRMPGLFPECGHSLCAPEGRRSNCTGQPGDHGLLEGWTAKTA